MKVAIISGHAGPGTGANGFIDEGAETIWLRDRVEWYLCTKYNIVPEVDQDNEGLSTVVKKLSRKLKKQDICIDIHFDAAPTDKASGCTVYVPTRHTSDELVLANKILKGTIDVLGVPSRGVRREDESNHGKLAMLSGFDCCNILWEVCFVSNKNDSTKYFSNREQLAVTIADIINTVYVR